MARKADRPSPSLSATSFKVGHTSTGNDGATYVVTASKTGVKRWKKVAEAVGLNRARLYITPSLMFSSDRESKEIKVATYLKNASRYEDVVGKRALKIVRDALGWVKGAPVDGDHEDAEVRQVLTVAFDMARLQYVVDVKYTGTLRDLRAIAEDILYVNYSGADTWMEGDIHVNDDHELFLKLARAEAS